jgi:methionyl-tRNA synthetase
LFALESIQEGKMNTTKTYVTSTIPFVNAHPHVGFALELVQTDVIARYHRLLGREVRFQTGTDEHAFKNVLSARERGIPTETLVDENSALFRRLCGVLNVSQDRFVRTTEPAHKTAVRSLWQRLKPEDLYLRSYTGLYCVGCEDFYLERDLVDGVCPDHRIKPITVEEENYFFRLSAYQSRLEDLLRSGTLQVVPEARRNEVLQFVRSGLRDISVSRVARRAQGWGIPVPHDTSQVIYVWIDALINYLSGLGFGAGDSWQQFWNEDTRKIHVIGKNVWKFHAVYWPALLWSAGVALPDTILVHGFLTQEGRKISKSLGNGVDPVDYVERFGADGVRYYLLRYVRPFEDGDFSAERLRDAYNADLANGIGNLCSRLTGLCERTTYRRFDTAHSPAAPDGYHDALERFEFDRGLEILWDKVRTVNRDIERTAPWSLINEGSIDAARASLRRWLRDLYEIAHWLAPFLPETSERIQSVLRSNGECGVDRLFPRVD